MPSPLAVPPRIAVMRRIPEPALDLLRESGDLWVSPHDRPGLLDLESVVLIPHLGSATIEARTAMGVLAAQNVAALLAGRRPSTPVNPEVLGGAGA